MKETDIRVDQFNYAEIINMNELKIYSLHNNASKQLIILDFLTSSVTSESRLSKKVLFVILLENKVLEIFGDLFCVKWKKEDCLYKTLN